MDFTRYQSERTGGVGDLSSHFYCPRRLPIMHECFVHKLKNLLQGLQRQKPAAAAGEYVISLENMRRVAELAPRSTGHLGFCRRAFDVQISLAMEAVAMDEGFKQKLIVNGCVTDALVLDVVGIAHQAFGLPSLTASERWARQHTLSYLIWNLWGEKLFIPGPHGINISKKTRIQGLVPDSLLAMLSNADGRAWLLKTLPKHEADIFVEKCLSNDDVEGVFGGLIQRLGFKASVKATLAALRTNETRHLARCDPKKEFSATMSLKKRYDAIDAADKVRRMWKDGSNLDIRSIGYHIYMKVRTDVLRRALKGMRFIRDHHRVKV